MASRSASAVARFAAWIARALGPRAMRIVARVNHYLTNPVQRLWAQRLRYMAVVEHRGCTSGKAYRTPVMAFVDDDEVCIVLNYGEQSDWVRNVMTAGSAQLVNRGTRYTLSQPSVLDADSAKFTVAAPRAIGGPRLRVLRAILAPALRPGQRPDASRLQAGRYEG